jgi:hypothetical protein
MIDYTDQDFVAETKAATSNRGVELILDIQGASYLNRNIEALADGGCVVIIGLQGGRTGEIDLGAMLAKRAIVAATTLRSRTTADKASIVAGVRAEVWPLIEAKKILAVVDRTVPMSQAATAHEIMATSDHIGKVLLVTEPRLARPADPFVEATPPAIEISPAIETAPSGDPGPAVATETAPGTRTDAAPEPPPPRAAEPQPTTAPPRAAEPPPATASPTPAPPTASLYTSDAAALYTSDAASVYTSDAAASENTEPADPSDAEPPAETSASDGQDRQDGPDQAEPAPVIARGSASVADAVDARGVPPQTSTHRAPQQTPGSSAPPQSAPSAGEETPGSGHTGNASVAGPTH